MTKRVFHPWRSVILPTLFVAACFALALAAQGQASLSAASTAPAKMPTFEVVSVKLSKPGCDDMVVASNPARFWAHCTTLLGLLHIAYPLSPNVSIPGLPDWGEWTHFDVDAKADDETSQAMQTVPDEEQQRQAHLMLQAVLRDRFKLRVHNETREGPVYNLAVAKRGFKLKEAPASKRPPGSSCARDHIQLRSSPIGSLAFCLSAPSGRKVVDTTRLTGNYAFTLTWTPDDQQATPDAGPTLFTALEEQLGLKLVPAKGLVEVFIVDHVERPTEN